MAGGEAADGLAGDDELLVGGHDEDADAGSGGGELGLAAAGGGVARGVERDAEPGEVVSVQVIPRPHDDVQLVLPKAAKK